MADEFISRREFENLKEEVDKIKKDMTESAKILQEIERKIDIIYEKINTSDKIDDLKFAPIDKRIKSLEDNQGWLWKTIGGTIIGVAIKVFFDVYKSL